MAGSGNKRSVRLARATMLPGLLVAGLASCSHARNPPLAEVGRDEVERATPRQVDAEFRDLAERMAFWLDVTIPPQSEREAAPPAFSAYGYSVTRPDYDLGYTHYLAGREPSPAHEEDYRARLREQLALLRWLEDTGGLANESFRIQLRQTVRTAVADRVLQHELARRPVTDDDIKTRYQDRQQALRTEEMVEIRLIQVASVAEAEALLSRLESGESFRALASEASIHESRSNFGEVEPFARGTYIDALEEVAFTMPVGDVVIADTEAGVFLLQKVAFIPSAVTPLEEVAPMIRRELEAERRTTLMEQILATLDGADATAVGN